MGVKTKQINYLLVIGMLLGAVGCATVDVEEKSYPSSWPDLVDRRASSCAPPSGMFANIASREKLQYENQTHWPSPSLEAIFGATLKIDMATHVRTDEPQPGTMRIRTYGLSEGYEVTLDEQLLDLDKARCVDGRLSIVTDTIYPGISSYEEESYNPLVTAAYVVGTLGIGAPISRWWDYRFALGTDGSLIVRRVNIESGLLFLMYIRTAMDDDWFLFEAVDASDLAGLSRPLVEDKSKDEPAEDQAPLDRPLQR